MKKTFIAVVGEENEEFTLHTDIASRSSKFLQAALDKDPEEPQQKHVAIKEVEAKHFELYLQWLYTSDHSFLAELSMRNMATLYILGDFLDDTAFRVALLHDFTKYAIDKNVYPDLTTVTRTWEKTPRDSLLRKMIVEMWVTPSLELLVKQSADVEEDISKAFVMDCLRRTSEEQALVRPMVLGLGDERTRALDARKREVLKELMI